MHEADDFDIDVLEQMDERPMVRGNMALPRQFDVVRDALARDPKLYWMGGSLVYDTGDTLARLNRGTLAVLVEKRCNVHKLTGKGLLVPCRPDEQLLSALLAMPGPGPIKALKSLRTDPVVDRYGQQILAGYDIASQQLIRDVEVERGGDLRALLADMLADYDEGARAGFLALLVGRLARAHYSTQPGWIIDANQPRAGKTTLAQILSLMLCGRPASLSPMPSDDAEVGKGLASRVTLSPVVIYDNVTRELSSDTIETYLSSEEWHYRMLGKDETRVVRTDAIIAFSANGCRAGKDISDRCVVTRIVRPNGPARWHHPDPLERALELRAAVLGAVLDAVEAHAATGWPSPRWEDTGRNPGWNKWARSLAWQVYGVDVLSGSEQVDEETEQLGELLSALLEGFGEEPFKPRDVLFGEGAEWRENARLAVASLMKLPLAKVDERYVGLCLGKYKDRWARDMQAKRARVGEARALGWQVKRADSTGS